MHTRGKNKRKRCARVFDTIAHEKRKTARCKWQLRIEKDEAQECFAVWVGQIQKEKGEWNIDRVATCIFFGCDAHA